MLLAPKLQKGDTIGVVVPSNFVDEEKYVYVNKFKCFMNGKGFEVILCDNFCKTDSLGFSGGSIEERVNDLNIFIRDPNIKCIWFFQGGETANQLIEYIDFNCIKNNPKIFIGKSDCDLLLNTIYSQTGLITFHGCDAKIGDLREMDYEYTQNAFHNRFILGKKGIEISDSDSRYSLKAGEATGKIFGCNLRCLRKSVGTKYFPKLEDNFIFFIEGYKLNSGQVTYMLEHFRLLGVLSNCVGVLSNCVGVVVGSFFEFEKGSIDEVVLDFFKDYNIPIMRTNEFGHYQPHAFIPIGAEIYMNTETKDLEIISEFLR